MSRSECGALVALCLVVGGCRGRDVAMTDAGVTPSEAPRVEPPTAIGGGPTSDDVYSSSGALNVLSAAWCERANACGRTADCEADAAQRHGEDLARCVKGIDASILSDCAHQIRTASCDSGVALAETCTAAVLCVRD